MHFMTRRETLAGTTVAALGAVVGRVSPSAPPALSVEAGGDATVTFTDALAKLKKWLTDWQRQLVKVGLGSYTNDGFWSTGTGFVLPAIADQDAGFAAELTGQLVASMEKTSFAEWISADQKGGAAKGFLAGIAMPALGLRSIIEKRPLLAYF
jgi:hypothetical protein